ncbi:MAG: hypothetical protein K0V04_02470 [Deltaproteobacteria bacterium]|nr:hypothetical protein [Deltaproteobacteria bacterium]
MGRPDHVDALHHNHLFVNEPITSPRVSPCEMMRPLPRGWVALAATVGWLASRGPVHAAPADPDDAGASAPDGQTDDAADADPSAPQPPASVGPPIDDGRPHTVDPTATPTVAISDALALEVGATCLEHDRLSEQVVTWLGRDDLDPRLTVVVEGDDREARTLRFTLRDRGTVIAERDFPQGPSRCDDLHSVVALAIALAIDATVLESVGVSQPVAPTPEPIDVKPLPPDPPAEVQPRVEPVVPPDDGLDLTPPKPNWHLRAHGRALLTLGAPPTVGGGGQLGLELSWRNRVDLQLGALASSAGSQSVADGSLNVTLAAGRADLCWGPQLGLFRPRVCGGVVAGTAVGESQGFARDFRIAVPWLAGAVAADLRVRLAPRLRLSFGLDGLVTVLQPVFDVREELGVRQLRDLPRFGAALGVGLVVVLK